MDNMKPKLITKQAVVIDLVLTVVFFETAVLLGAAYCGLCLAGVFWMALSLFRVTLADQMLPKTVDDRQSN
ncbi:MAG: hypothetical protein CAK86_02575 [Opitutia bacterium AMD-G1]|nr:MAG: hypothetical protein CAK86_02575 [Opitutae bacterium AMD-G1]